MRLTGPGLHFSRKSGISDSAPYLVRTHSCFPVLRDLILAGCVCLANYVFPLEHPIHQCAAHYRLNGCHYDA